MFSASTPVVFCDYFRIPYSVEPDRSPGGRLQWDWLSRGERTLTWPRGGDLDAPALVRVGSVPVFVRLASEEAMSEPLAATGSWKPLLPIVDESGRQTGSVWQEERGSIALPFDPSEAIESFWSEAYRAPAGTSAAGRAKQLAMRAYYRARPLLPRRAQIGMRRLFSRVQARSAFPRWPLEPALHDLYDLLFAWVARVAGEPVPWIGPWPSGRSWALVLTHDVETRLGYEHVHVLREVERRAGVRSSWNFVPKRYAVGDAVVEELLAAGFEVGVHGLYHDGRDVESEATLRERLPEIRRFAERWRAVGFRSPATHRDWDLMPLLGFDYDSSSPDTDPFEPQSGGCCSLLPFFNRELVELPITLPQDHTLFVILSHQDESAWVEKAAAIRRAGGMALLITHPDYMIEPRLVELYERFLARHSDDPTLWKALPRDVASWWRRRAVSHVVPADKGWRVVGPAADEASLRFAEPGAS